MMKKRTYFVAVITILFLGFLINVPGTKVLAEETEDRICAGIFIDSINIGGMTEKQAMNEVEKYVKDLQKKKVEVKIEEHKVETTVGDLGYHCVENKYIKEALNFGKTGNLIKRYKELKDVEHEQLIYHLEYELDPDIIREFVKIKCTDYNVDAEDAVLKRVNGQFVITPDKVGRKVQIDDTVEKIKSAILEDWDRKDIVLEAIVIDDVPKLTKASLEKCTDVLGTYSTNYYTSSSNRANNIANAARLINGTVLKPGDTFSAANGMSPITVENGYYIGGAYKNGEVIESVGGGVCQVSTTLYNASLLAELQVVERHNHSMIVTYVEPAMDAAIAGTFKDLKLKNNTDAPIYIEAYTNNRTVTFNIYGHETRDTTNRTVKYVSETLEEIPAGADKITKDPTKPKSYREVTQSAHIGYKANLWKIVYENGKQVSKEKVNYSYYAPEPARVVIGTREDEAKEPAKEEKKQEKVDVVPEEADMAEGSEE